MPLPGNRPWVRQGLSTKEAAMLIEQVAQKLKTEPEALECESVTKPLRTISSSTIWRVKETNW